MKWRLHNLQCLLYDSVPYWKSESWTAFNWKANRSNKVPRRSVSTLTKENRQNVPQSLKEWVRVWLSASLFKNSWWSAQVLVSWTRFHLESCLEEGRARGKWRRKILEKQMADGNPIHVPVATQQWYLLCSQRSQSNEGAFALEIIESHKMQVKSNNVFQKIKSNTEWSKSGREKQMPYINTYMWNLEKWCRWNYCTGQEYRHRHGGQTCGHKQDKGDRMNWETGTDRDWHAHTTMCKTDR